jgi:hypothetical protein
MNDESGKNMPAVAGDGFSDVDDEGYGTFIENPPKVKFGNDSKWTRGDQVIPSSRTFLVINIVRVIQHWVGQLPTNKSRALELGEKWPDIDELNAAAPPEEWRDHFGRRIGPWQKTYMAYLFDPKTKEVFTYPTATAGGFRAMRGLCKETERVRRVRGQEVYPLITLADAYMPTQFGGRQRPHFNIVGYQPLGPVHDAPAQIEHGNQKDRRERGPNKRAEKPAKPEFDNDIPWK